MSTFCSIPCPGGPCRPPIEFNLLGQSRCRVTIQLIRFSSNFHQICDPPSPSPDLPSQATPCGNQLIASLTPSLVPQHYFFMARDSAAQVHHHLHQISHLKQLWRQIIAIVRRPKYPSPSGGDTHCDPVCTHPKQDPCRWKLIPSAQWFVEAP